MLALAYWCYMFFLNLTGITTPSPTFRYDKSFDIAKTTPSGVKYTINNSTATFDLDIARPDLHGQKVFPTYEDALRYCQAHRLSTIPSVQMIQAKCKNWEDEICPLLENSVQKGFPALHIAGRQELLRQLLEHILQYREQVTGTAKEKGTQAAAHVGAALELGGSAVNADEEVTRLIATKKAHFLANPLASRVVGFWDTSKELEQQFQQDRFLMGGLPASELATAILLSHVLTQNPALAQNWAKFQEFDARLTNPGMSASFQEMAALFPEHATLAELMDEKILAQLQEKWAKKNWPSFALVSYATNKEYDILQRFTTELQSGASTMGILIREIKNDILQRFTTEMQAGAPTMGILIREIKNGRVPLEPKSDSGWYDYEWYALETLLRFEIAREAVKLNLSPAYKNRLEQAFKTSITAMRETRIKALPYQTLGGDISYDLHIELGPEFGLEPMATVYLRLARGYRFLSKALGEVLGKEWLERIHKPTSSVPVAEELQTMALWLYGLYERVCLDIGQLPQYCESEIEAEELAKARAIATQWLTNFPGDHDLKADPRVAVVIAYDPMQDTTRHWAVAGIQLVRVKYSYHDKPHVSGLEPVLVPSYYYLATPVFLEFDRKGASTFSRSEFRALCSTAKEKRDIKEIFGTIPETEVSGQHLTMALTSIAGIIVAVMLILVFRKYPRRTLMVFFLGMVSGLGALILGCLFSYTVRVHFTLKYVMPLHDKLAVMGEEFLRNTVPCSELVPCFADLLSDADPQTRYFAAKSINYATREKLPCRGPHEIADRDGFQKKIRKATHDPVIEVAAEAMLQLDHTQENVDFLIAQLRQKANIDAVCIHALRKLGRDFQEVRAVANILPFAKDPRTDVRSEAVLALREIGAPCALDYIIPLFSDPEPIVRIIAMRSMPHFNDDRAVSALVELIQSPEEKVRDRGYGMIEFAFQGIQPYQWSSRMDSGRCKLLLDKLVALASQARDMDKMERAIERASRHPDAEVRAKAAEALAKVRTRKGK